jgi:hypothetical protein
VAAELCAAEDAADAASSRGRKKKWHSLDSIDLAARLGVAPSEVVFASSMLCRAGVCEDGGLTRIFNRYQVLGPGQRLASQPAARADLAKKLRGHSLEIQRRALARVDEMVALLGRSAELAGDDGSGDDVRVSEFIWGQIGGYFEENGGVTPRASPSSPLAFDEESWQQVENLVLSGAVPHDDPVLVARFAAGVGSPRISRLKLGRASAFGVAASCDWLLLLEKAKAVCGRFQNKLL